MSGANGNNQDVDIDLGRVIAAVWARKARIIGVTALVAAAALVSTSLMTPSYRAETRLLIESRSPNLTGGDGAGAANDPVLDALNITSQAQLLQSTDLIKRVVTDLNLTQHREFDPTRRSLIPDLLVLTGLKPDPMALDPEDRVIGKFREKLEVYAVENSRVIAVEFSSHDPVLAAAVPNKMAEVYLQLQSGAKLENHSETAKWLEPEIASLTERVREAERKVADYRAENGLFQTADNSTLSAQQLNNISTELARVRAERANAEARAENVRTALQSGRESDTIADVVSSQVIQRLKEVETNLQAQISDQSISLLEGHPRIRGLRAQLAGIRQQIDAETRKILGSLDSEADVSRLREQQLVAQLNTLKADSARAGEEEVGLRALEREAAAQRQLLETYLARYREATSRLDINATPADARIVSQAVEPSEPYFPKVIPIVIVVTLATLIISCLIVMVAELFSGRALRPVGRRDADEADVSPEDRNVAPAPAAVEASAVEPTATEPPSAEPVSAHSRAYEPVPAPVPSPVATPAAPVAAAEPTPSAEPMREPTAEPARAEIADRAVPRPRQQNLVEADEKAFATPPLTAAVIQPAPQAAARISDQPVETGAAVAPAKPVDTSFSIASVAHYLQRNAVPVAVSVSPEGDDGSTATVMLARAVAEAGRTVILVDLTGTACPTRLMAEHDRLAGITDLLCGESAFGEAIHTDRLSTAHIVPQGVSDPARAMRAADRLTMIIDALSDAYDLVLIECGPADIDSLKRLVRGDTAEIILSVPGYAEEDIADLVVSFDEAGFRHLLVMAQPQDRQSPPTRRRSAA